MNPEEDQRTASGLALVDFRLGLIETNLDLLGKKFDTALERLPTTDTLALTLQPYVDRINNVESSIKTMHKDIETLQKLEPIVDHLNETEKARASMSRQLKLVVAGAILSPIIAVIISAVTVFFTVNGGIS